MIWVSSVLFSCRSAGCVCEYVCASCIGYVSTLFQYRCLFALRSRPLSLVLSLGTPLHHRFHLVLSVVGQDHAAAVGPGGERGRLGEDINWGGDFLGYCTKNTKILYKAPNKTD